MERNRDDGERRRRALKRILDHYSITPAQLAQQARFSANILYNLLNGQSQSLSSVNHPSLKEEVC